MGSVRGLGKGRQPRVARYHDHRDTRQHDLPRDMWRALNKVRVFHGQRADSFVKIGKSSRNATRLRWFEDPSRSYQMDSGESIAS